MQQKTEKQKQDEAFVLEQQEIRKKERVAFQLTLPQAPHPSHKDEKDEEKDEEKDLDNSIIKRFQSKYHDLAAEYEKQFNRKMTDDHIMSFATMEEAVAFFEAQAKLGHVFLACRVDEQKNFMDDNCFSCGDGTLYRGTFAEIASQLESVIRADTSNTHARDGLVIIKSYMPPNANPVKSARDDMRDLRTKQQSKESVPVSEESSTPTPLSRSPRKI